MPNAPEREVRWEEDLRNEPEREVMAVESKIVEYARAIRLYRIYLVFLTLRQGLKQKGIPTK
jgi:hypothetical protein